MVLPDGEMAGDIDNRELPYVCGNFVNFLLFLENVMTMWCVK